MKPECHLRCRHAIYGSLAGSPAKGNYLPIELLGEGKLTLLLLSTSLIRIILKGMCFLTLHIEDWLGREILLHCVVMLEQLTWILLHLQKRLCVCVYMCIHVCIYVCVHSLFHIV